MTLQDWCEHSSRGMTAWRYSYIVIPIRAAILVALSPLATIAHTQCQVIWVTKEKYAQLGSRLYGRGE